MTNEKTKNGEYSNIFIKQLFLDIIVFHTKCYFFFRS